MFFSCGFNFFYQLGSSHCINHHNHLLPPYPQLLQPWAKEQSMVDNYFTRNCVDTHSDVPFSASSYTLHKWHDTSNPVLLRYASFRGHVNWCWSSRREDSIIRRHQQVPLVLTSVQSVILLEMLQMSRYEKGMHDHFASIQSGQISIIKSMSKFQLTINNWQ